MSRQPDIAHDRPGALTVSGPCAMAPRDEPRAFQELPGHDPRAPRLLERAGLPDPPALRHAHGRGHLPPGDHAARARSRAVERRLRPAEPPPDRRALRREPQPAAALLPVPGDPEAQPGEPAGALPQEPRGDRHRSARARHPLRRGRLGKPDARRLGPRLGSLVRRDGSDPVHLLPADGRVRLQAGRRRARLTGSSGWRCTSRASTTSTTSISTVAA